MTLVQCWQGMAAVASGASLHNSEDHALNVAFLLLFVTCKAVWLWSLRPYSAQVTHQPPLALLPATSFINYSPNTHATHT
jgi:hypothetical protein